MLPKGSVASITESARTLGEGVVGTSGEGAAPSLDLQVQQAETAAVLWKGVHGFQAISSHP